MLGKLPTYHKELTRPERRFGRKFQFKLPSKRNRNGCAVMVKEVTMMTVKEKKKKNNKNKKKKKPSRISLANF
jgi:hypothetical protein